MPSNPSLETLRTFVTVFRAGSFSRAAELLGISQPTVTSRVQSLEHQLGVPLFERSSHGVVATSKGVTLARRLEPHLDAIEDATEFAGLPAVSTPLQVGGPVEILSAKVLPRFAALAEAVGAPVHFTFGLAQSLIERLVRHDLDLVVSAVQPHSPGIHAQPLYDEVFALVAAPRWAGTPLDEIPAVVYAEDLPIVRRYWRTVFGTRPTTLTVGAVIPDLRGIVDAVTSGAGMSVLPDYLIADGLRSGALISLDSPEVAPLNTVYLATRSGELERDARLATLAAGIRELIR